MSGFIKEADLCAAFLECVPDDWTAYPETCNFDIVLVHKGTGIQIGIEAKLVLNAKVLAQVLDGRGSRYDTRGPDFRAVLVGRVVAENATLAQHLGIRVLEVEPRHPQSYVPRGQKRTPYLVRGDDWTPCLDQYRTDSAEWIYGAEWTDEAPAERLRLPEYVPQVTAGVPAPLKLSVWTIQAIRLCILIGCTGTVTRAHFTALKINPTRWCNGRWLQKAQRGHWSPGPHFPGPNFRTTHPVTWAQIEADWPKWGPPVLEKVGGTQGALL
ncbi:MAG: hypothetical protein RL268_2784 [Pseudomonadota bacterium]|jgi:hypothetical protein